MSNYERYADEYYPAAMEGGVQAYVQEGLNQAPWWLISLAAHGFLGVMLMMLSFTSYKPDQTMPIESTIEEPEQDTLDDQLDKEPFEETRDFETDEPTIEDPIISDAEISDHAETDNNEDYEQVKGVEDAQSDKPFQGKYWNSAIGVGGGAGGALGGRFGGNRNLRPYGGGKHTKRAVNWGLDWLKRHQNPNGMWSCDKFMMNCDKGTCSGKGSTADYDTGVTGLALLAFLGDGNTHKNGKYKNTVKKALMALRTRQTPDGCVGSKSGDGHWIYNHAICTMALSEAYGMTGTALIKNNAQKAVDFLLECQNPGLGWRYGVQPGDSDTSVTGWAVLALKSAKMSQLHVPRESFDGALRWFDKMTDTGYYRTGYSSRGDVGARPAEAQGKFQPADAMTAAALISRIFILGETAKNRPEVLGAANLLKQNPPKWDVKGGTIDMYYWYYGTLAMFQMGKPYWSAWNEHMKDALVHTQCTEGCPRGSWDPAGPWGSAGGRVYATAINVLSLEIYYRYSRIFKDRNHK